MVMLLCSLCGVCLAGFNMPTDDRWVIWHIEPNKQSFWLDIDDIEFSTSSEAGHEDHNGAR